MRRRISFAVAGVLLVFGATSCGGDPTTGDFQDEAERFIESDEFAQDPTVGVEVVDAQCTEPAATAIATKFSCTGTGPDGEVYNFDAEISGERELSVGINAGGAATTTTTPAAPTTTSAAPTTTTPG